MADNGHGIWLLPYVTLLSVSLEPRSALVARSPLLLYPVASVQGLGFESLIRPDTDSWFFSTISAFNKVVNVALPPPTNQGLVVMIETLRSQINL